MSNYFTQRPLETVLRSARCRKGSTIVVKDRGGETCRPGWSAENAEAFRVGYYGASFTLLPSSVQHSFLEVLSEFPVKGLYISTRPEGVSEKICQHLQKYGLQRVELGVQSLDRGVLARCQRRYTPFDVQKSLHILSEMNIERSAHIMVGLPGQTEESILRDVNILISWGITHIRIHPVLVLKNTELENMYKRGDYIPWTLERSAQLCVRILKKCQENEVKVLRLGVQPSCSLEKEGNIVAGPYHPSFGEICYSYYYRQEIENYLKTHCGERVRVRFPRRLRSQVIGPGKMNEYYFQTRYPASHLIFETGPVQEIQFDGGK